MKATVAILVYFVLYVSKVAAIHTCRVQGHETCDATTLKGETQIYPGGTSRCAFDDIESLQTQKEYFYLFTPGQGEGRNKLLIYFAGGGGCFGEVSCSLATIKLTELLYGNRIFLTNPVHNGYEGIFDRSNKQNPFQHFSVVQIPLCTGDSNTGDKTIDDLHHNGANNVREVLKWTYRNFPNPDRLVIAGCSAGSIGAQVWAANIIHHYRQLGSTAQINVIADSYTGVVPRKKSGLAIKRWGTCNNEWIWTEKLKRDCLKGTLYFPEFISHTIKMNPDVAFSFIVNKDDHVEKLIYCVMKNLLDLMCLNEIEFFSKTQYILHQYIKASKDNVAVYMLEGDDHCILQQSKFYTVNAPQANDPAPLIMRDWAANLVSDRLRNISVPSKCEQPEVLEMACDFEVANAVINLSGNSSLLPPITDPAASIKPPEEKRRKKSKKRRRQPNQGHPQSITEESPATESVGTTPTTISLTVYWALFLFYWILL